MQNNRRKRAPGVSEHLKQISQIKNEIVDIQKNIKSFEQKINDEYKKQDKKSEIQSLRKERVEIKQEIDALVKQRNELRTKRTAVIDEIKGNQSEIREKMSSNDNPKSINDQIISIQNKIIAQRMSPKEEEKYRKTLSELRMTSKVLSGLEGKEKTIYSLEQTKQKYSKEIEEINKVFAERKAELAELDKMIDSFVAESTKKNPTIIRFEDELARLKKIRDEKYNAKKAVSEIIKGIEDEYNKYMIEIEKAEKMENDLKDQNKKIQSLNSELSFLIDERNSVDPKKFDQIIASVKKIKDLKVMSLSVCTIFTENRLKIPKTQEELKKTIEILEERKKEYKNGVSGKLSEYNARIDNKRKEIIEEQRRLDDMNTPEFELEIKKIKSRNAEKL